MFYYYNYKFKKYINFDKLFFDKINVKRNGKILCEFTNNFSNIVAFSYLNFVLKQKFQCESVGYINYFKKNLLSLLIMKFKKIINYKLFSLYKSFLVDDFIIAHENYNVEKKVDTYLKNNLSKIKNTRNLLNLKINNILIGDYIYDSFLKTYKEPTIHNLHDKVFINFFKKNLCSFFF